MRDGVWRHWAVGETSMRCVCSWRVRQAMEERRVELVSTIWGIFRRSDSAGRALESSLLSWTSEPIVEVVNGRVTPCESQRKGR